MWRGVWLVVASRGRQGPVILYRAVTVTVERERERGHGRLAEVLEAERKLENVTEEIGHAEPPR